MVGPTHVLTVLVTSHNNSNTTITSSSSDNTTITTSSAASDGISHNATNTPAGCPAAAAAC